MSGTKVAQTQKAYSLPEELTNFITYAVGAALSFVGLVFLLVLSFTRSSVGLGCFAVYAFVAAVVFTVGALCHILPIGNKAKLICKRFDRAAVCVLVSGAFVPLLTVGLASGTHTDAIWAYALVSIILAATIAAVVLNLVGVPSLKIYILALYIVVAWACVMRMNRIVELCGWDMFWLLFAGGAMYFFGTVICSFRNLPARHCVWHIFMLCGAVLHFVSIYSFVM